jgi:putative addiction module killer protein
MAIHMSIPEGRQITRSCAHGDRDRLSIAETAGFVLIDRQA